jgi:hypothetical protein
MYVGAPDDEERMVGDLGNIEADDAGVSKVSYCVILYISIY